MKKFIWFLTLSLLTANLSFAQFEGTITFDIKVSGEASSQMGAMMPDSYEYNIKGKNIRMHMKGGMAAMMVGDILVQGETGDVYMLKDADKKAYVFSQKHDVSSDSKPDIIKLDEHINVLGYDCQKYKLVIKGDNGETTTQYAWITDKIKVEKPKGETPGSMRNLFREGIDGFPLKLVSDVNVPSVANFTITFIASNINPSKLDKSLFEVPKDYTIEEFDMTRMGGF